MTTLVRPRLGIAEHTDALVAYLSGEEREEPIADKQWLATLLLWHDIPHPRHLSHVECDQGETPEHVTAFWTQTCRRGCFATIVISTTRSQKCSNIALAFYFDRVTLWLLCNFCSC